MSDPLEQNQPPQDPEAGSDLIPANPEDFIKPQFLNEVVEDPDRLYQQLVNQGSTTAEAGRKVDAVLYAVNQDIMIPELVALTSAEAAQATQHKVAEFNEAAGHAVGRIEAVAQSKVLEGINQTREKMEPYMTVLNRYKEGEPTDPSTVRQAIDLLQEEIDMYGKQHTEFSQLGPDARSAAMSLEAEVDDARSGVRKIDNNLGDDIGAIRGLNSASSFDDVKNAVRDRGAPTVSEHRQAAEADFAANDAVIAGVTDGLNKVHAEAQELTAPVADLNRVAEKDLPSPRKLHNDLDFVRAAIAQLNRHGAPMHGQLVEALHTLDMSVRTIESGVNKGLEAQAQLKTVLQATSAALQGLSQPQ